MRRLASVVTVCTSVAVLLISSHYLMLVTATQEASYTASADYTLAVPAISLANGWQTTLHIQNTGAGPTSARIEFFDAGTTECSAEREPTAVRCLGPIPAGATATLNLDDDPALAGIHSAMVHAVRAGESGCGTSPGEPLAVVVRRTWAGGGDEPRVASSAYVGPAPAVNGFWDAQQKAYLTIIPWVEIGATKQTILHLQNTGLECAAGIELALISSAGCMPAFQTALPPIMPGHALRFDPADELEGSFSGSVWIRSPQPLAVVADRWLNGQIMLATHAVGRAVAHLSIDAPLIFRDGNGQRTMLRIQNASTRFTAMAHTIYHDTDITTTAELTPLAQSAIVCPGSSISLEAVSATDPTTAFTGTVNIRSQALGPDQPEIPEIVADIDLIDPYGGAAYRGSNRITAAVSSPDVALPWLTRLYRPMTATTSITFSSQIAMVNQSDMADGFLSLRFYDPDGSVTTYQVDRPLAPQTMHLLDLRDVSALPAGWYGSAVVEFLSTQRGTSLGVAVLERGTGASGDAISSYAGIVTHVQAQPTPTLTPTPAATATPTPQPTRTPTARQVMHATFLPLIARWPRTGSTLKLSNKGASVWTR